MMGSATVPAQASYPTHSPLTLGGPCFTPEQKQKPSLGMQAGFLVTLCSQVLRGHSWLHWWSHACLLPPVLPALPPVPEHQVLFPSVPTPQPGVGGSSFYVLLSLVK